MKTLNIVLVLLLLISVGYKANAETEVREVRSFEKVSFRIDGTMFIKQGSKQEVKLIGSEKFLDHVIVEVDNNTLVIRYPNERIFKNNNFGKIEIFVTVEDLRKLSVLGSGDIVCKGTIDTDRLDINISGSGDLRLGKLKCTDVGIDLAGSGDVVFEGTGEGDELDINIFGSGDVVCPDFKVDDVDIKIFGSGDCDVYPIDELDVKIFGSGDVRYKGKPDNVHSSIFGSGEVRRMK